MKVEDNRKSNKQFMILSAIAIFFVVDAHAWSALGILDDFFPYNSFFMPLFVFISGYFFDIKYLEKPLCFCKRKFLKLLMPYHIIVGVFFWASKIISFFTGYLKVEELTMPGWFVPILFGVNLVWFLFRYILKKYWNEYVATVLYCIISTWCVYLSRNDWNKTEWLPLLKIGFFIQFFQLGVLYKNKLQKYFERIPKIVIIISTISINAYLQFVTQNNINFYNLNSMSGFLTDIYVLPLITSITGIAFWLVISKELVPIWGENKLVNYISNHTFTIMMFHMTFFALYNFLISRIPMVAKDFDFDTFYATAWYRYEPVNQLRVFYTFVGMLGPIILHYCYEKIGEKIKEKLKILNKR